MSNIIRVATTQFNHRFGDKDYNLGIIEKMCREASGKGVQIITFPEMCVTGYWHVRNLSRNEVEALAENGETGPSVVFLEKLSKELNLIIGAGIIEMAEDGRLYNTFLVTQPDYPVKSHRKLHCFISEFMSSGDQFTVIDTSLGIKLGVLICWDNNLVENARMTALAGADILLAPHQTGGCHNKSSRVMGGIDVELWENRNLNPETLRREFQGFKGKRWLYRWLPSRAHDNGFFLMFSNGVGRDDDEVRTGNAMLIDCHGDVLAESTAIGDDMVIGNFDIDLLAEAIGRNWIQGRRPGLYRPLTISRGGEKDPITLKFSE